MKRRETIPSVTKGAIWQSETARNFLCPKCPRTLFTQDETDDDAMVVYCGGWLGEHIIEYSEKSLDPVDPDAHISQ